MSWPDFYLLCFAVGALWALATLLGGGLHLGHGHGVHGLGGHGSAGHGPLGHGHVPAGARGAGGGHVVWSGLMNPSCWAVFVAWFGGVGYLLTRHAGWGFWINLGVATAVGFAGAGVLAAFLQFLQSREQPLNPADYEMVGVLGRVTSTIRPQGVGEMIYTRDGARRAVPARSEEARQIDRGEEVIVTAYNKGVASVRTWDAMTQRALSPRATRKEENEHVD